MPELYLTGPDAFRLLNRIGVNSLANLNPGMAKQFIGCNPRGQMIGDCILYDLGEATYELVSSMPLLNWVEYQARAGGWDVAIERDNNTSDNPAGRLLIGLAAYTGYSINERKILSIALLDTEHATPGEEVTLLWGEPDGGSRKPRVELHQQTLVRATVAPAPYPSAVRQMMRSAVGPSAR
jgi:glycine cleavage system aminomethyltransferase T